MAQGGRPGRSGPPGHEHGRTHGAFSVATRGPEALPAELRSREVEVVSNLATSDGVLRELEEAAHRQWAICETGYLYLSSLMADGRNIWADGEKREPVAILKMLGSYENGLVRTLRTLAELRKDKETIDLDTLLGKERGHADTGE